jgi:predicted amidophosphoribosyltransferase
MHPLHPSTADESPNDAAPMPDAPALPLGPRQMLCPACGHPMPDLKGGKASICENCGYKDSCCY